MKIPLFVGTVVCCALVWIGGCRHPDEAVQERYVDVDAGGHRLHMLVVGASGPTVVLESGLGGGLGWEQVRAEVGRFAQVVTYDRAGFGESESGPRPRTARQIATEIHAALHNADLSPPYILVGHSMGGPYVRVFAALYPEEVSGMILVDPTQVNSYESMEEIKAWFETHCPQDWDAVEAYCNQMPEASQMLNWMRGLEVKRVEEFLATVPQPRRESMRREWMATLAGRDRSQSSTKLGPSVQDEFAASTESFQQAIAATPLPSVPIILLSASGFASPAGIFDALDPNLRELQLQVQRWHLDDYRTWVDATPGAKLVVAAKCGHNIQIDNPDVVVNEIHGVAQQAANSTDHDSPLTMK